MAGSQSRPSADSSSQSSYDKEREDLSEVGQADIDEPIEAEEKTIEIKTADDLRELSRVANSGDPAYLNMTYLLANDIDMVGESLEPIGQFTANSDQDSDSNGFNAVFDGQGYAIRNLKIHITMTEPEQQYSTGLFALIGSGGQVNNLRLEDCDISFVTGDGASAGNATGGLAGMSYGSVTNCSVSGKITGNYQVGGLIGASGWESKADSCSANASVTGESEIGAKSRQNVICAYFTSGKISSGSRISHKIKKELRLYALSNSFIRSSPRMFIMIAVAEIIAAIFFNPFFIIKFSFQISVNRLLRFRFLLFT